MLSMMSRRYGMVCVSFIILKRRLDKVEELAVGLNPARDTYLLDLAR